MRVLRSATAGLLASAFLVLGVPAVAPEWIPPPDGTVGYPPCEPTHGQRVRMKGVFADEFAFEPAAITVPFGTVVTWVNESPGVVLHTTTNHQGFWHSGNMVAGQTYSVLFCMGATFTYECIHHPGLMQGTVTVLPG